jgi:hypothetical protein
VVSSASAAVQPHLPTIQSTPSVSCSAASTGRQAALPLLSQGGAEEFDGIDLRTFQNYSWNFRATATGTSCATSSTATPRLEMGHDAEQGDYFHLYINGQYWGLQHV